MSPFIFSFVPRSQLEYGWQKYDLVPRALSMISCSACSEPLSYVKERLKCLGYGFKLAITTILTASAVRRSSLSISVYRLLRSTFTSKQTLLARLTKLSLSQCPTCLRSSIYWGRSSMDILLGIWGLRCFRLWSLFWRLRWCIARVVTKSCLSL